MGAGAEGPKASRFSQYMSKVSGKVEQVQHKLWGLTTWVQILALPLINWATLGKLPNWPVLFHLNNED